MKIIAVITDPAQVLKILPHFIKKATPHAWVHRLCALTNVP
jgi:hypothetical protein